jgi:hypothetical protein
MMMMNKPNDTNMRTVCRRMRTRLVEGSFSTVDSKKNKTLGTENIANTHACINVQAQINTIT